MLRRLLRLRGAGGGGGREAGETAERERLRDVARRAGVRIREHLRVADVLNEARAVIERDLGADAAYLHLVDEHGQLGLPIGHEHDWILPREFIVNMPPEMHAWVEDLFRTRGSMVLQDLTGPEGDQLPPTVRDAVRRAGIVAHLLTPFGGDSEMLGLIAADRVEHGRPWTGPEIEAVESIAADIGRGLHHARLYEKEERLAEELRSVDEMRAEFLTSTAHELRSPLTTIEGFLEMLREGKGGPLTAAQHGLLDAIERGAARLRSLIEDLFSLAKLESGAASTKAPLDLAKVVSEAAEAIRPSAVEGGLSLDLDVPQNLIIDGDADELDRAVTNLLSNAVKFTPGGGHVRAAAAAESGWAVVTVHDTGIGIPEQEAKRVFSRFFRASNAVEQRIAGSGLGLALVRAIVAGHGGEVDLRSQEGTGTTATMRLPLAAPGSPPGSPPPGFRLSKEAAARAST